MLKLKTFIVQYIPLTLQLHEYNMSNLNDF